MNKQKAIEKIEKLKGLTIKEKNLILDIEMISKGDVLEIIEQIDEPEKPVVPRCVADWYDDNQDDFEFNLYRLCVDYDNCELDKEMMIWFRDKNNNPIQTLTAMHQLGYEVKKEKLYRAKNRQTGEYLCYCFEFYHDKNSSSENQRFTAEEKRWEELGYWGNDLYVFEEAEGGDE